MVNKRSIWITSILLVISISTLLFVITSSVLQKSKEIRCKADLFQIYVALANYNDSYGHAPPLYTVNIQGEPMHSWRVLILEFIEPDLYDQFDLTKPWNSNHNLAVARNMPQWLRCESDQTGDPTSNSSYLAVAGENVVFRLNPDEIHVIPAVSERTTPPIVCIVEEASSDKLWTDPTDYVKIRDLGNYEVWNERHTEHSKCSSGPLVVDEEGKRWRVNSDSSYNLVISSFPKVK